MTELERAEMIETLTKFCDETSCDDCILKNNHCCPLPCPLSIRFWRYDDAQLEKALALITLPNANEDKCSPTLDEQLEDVVNQPSHYNQHEMECIDEMVAVFGAKATINFCGLNAWKYRYRADYKGKHDEDIAKSEWYVNKALELRQEWGINE